MADGPGLAGNQGGVSLDSLCEQTLHFRTAQYRSELIELVRGEGISAPSDLLRVSQQSLETKLATHAGFSFQQLADMVSLRSSAEQGAPAEPGMQRDHMGARDRSRSNGRDDQRRGRDGESRGGRRRRQGEGRRGGRGGRSEREERPPQQKPELWRAVEDGNEDIVRLCLSRPDIDAEEKYLGWSPLMKAAEEGHVGIMQLLFEKRVDLEVGNRKGRTALSFAAAPSRNGAEVRPTPIAALRWLLENGADVNHKDDTGLTAKEKAEKEERGEATLLLEEYERAASGLADGGSEP